MNAYAVFFLIRNNQESITGRVLYSRIALMANTHCFGKWLLQLDSFCAFLYFFVLFCALSCAFWCSLVLFLLLWKTPNTRDHSPQPSNIPKPSSPPTNFQETLGDPQHPKSTIHFIIPDTMLVLLSAAEAAAIASCICDY